MTVWLDLAVGLWLLAMALGGWSWRAALASGFGGYVAALALAVSWVAGPSREWALLPAGVRLLFGQDPTSGLFLLPVALVGAAISLYSWSYLEKYPDTGRPRVFATLFPLLGLSLLGLLLARDAWTFFAAWEMVALLSYLLVLLDYDHEGTTRAGWLMFAIAEAGALGMLLGFALLARLPGGALMLHPFGEPVIVFLLLVFGFAAKIGLLPLHIWLPEAHGRAPGNFSPALSGVVVTMGVYGLWRWVLARGPGGPTWEAVLLLLLGAATALFGVLYALAERDLKRVLAWSTVENMGIVVTAFGAARLFQDLHLSYLAAFAALGGLFHVLNHAVFKSLLFLNVGAVDRATGNRITDDLGGLLRRMPATATLTLLGALAITGLPPLNGFPGEWLTLQSLLHVAGLPRGGMDVVLALAGAALALTGALAITLFVKVFGVAFLGAPRSPAAAQAREVPAPMVVASAGLGAACVAAGFMPTVLFPPLLQVVAGTFHASVAGVVPPLFGPPRPATAPLLALGGGVLAHWLPVRGLTIVSSTGFASIAPAYLLLAVAGGAFLAFLLAHLPRRRPARRVVPAWAGGYESAHSVYQYTSTGYAGTVRGVFRSLYRLRVELTPGEGARSRYQHAVETWFERYLHLPVYRALRALASWVLSAQNGDVSWYLFWVVVAWLIVLWFGR